LITQYFVFLAWIPFRVHDTADMWYSIQKYVLFDFQMSESFTFLLEHKWPVGLMVLFVTLHFVIYLRPNIMERIKNCNLKWWTLVLTIILVSIIFFYNGDPEDFIYFRF